MANTRNGNTWYLDSVGALGTDTNVLVGYILLTPLSGSCQIILKDQVTGALKLDLQLDTAARSQQFLFEKFPLLFPNDIEIDTLVDCVATLVITKQGA